MPDNKIGPPPSSVADFNNPAWTTWFNKIHEATNLNKSLSHLTTAVDATADKEAIITVTSNKTITLPEAAKSEDVSYYIKRVTAVGAVTIASSDNIDGSASITLDANYDTVQVFCDGTTWHKVAAPTVIPESIAKVASSTDNAVPKFDGTDGDTVQDTGVLIDDDDNLYGHGSKIITVTGTTRTLTTTDNGAVLFFTNASAVAVTIPQTSTETIPAGFQCVCIQDGAGQLTFAKEGSDVLHSPDAAVLSRVQYSSIAVLKKTAGSPNTWNLFGDLV